MFICASLQTTSIAKWLHIWYLKLHRQVWELKELLNVVIYRDDGILTSIINSLARCARGYGWSLYPPLLIKERANARTFGNQIQRPKKKKTQSSIFIMIIYWKKKKDTIQRCSDNHYQDESTEETMHHVYDHKKEKKIKSHFNHRSTWMINIATILAIYLSNYSINPLGHCHNNE